MLTPRPAGKSAHQHVPQIQQAHEKSSFPYRTRVLTLLGNQYATAWAPDLMCTYQKFTKGSCAGHGAPSSQLCRSQDAPAMPPYVMQMKAVTAVEISLGLQLPVNLASGSSRLMVSVRQNLNRGSCSNAMPPMKRAPTAPWQRVRWQFSLIQQGLMSGTM